ncbi:MAG: phosphoribosylformylglycinamidine synthase I, partial [Actinobacteria bacterium]|nr:phosphoribosylformylglycinamidine synthase I [Actinomycetota bacterium]NIU64586.1 phosphoribosylformylglycinamidine synthase I [Actinomycetota bacterium]NIV54480.1 phosphoribosylformylglycinamidine synthase I [Actinomycetota bacterium]NIV85798.1 phosphoribosylformylglycinamidine synthase I [Actinomycetota bacterium]NIW26372.1 phosphoribosylformylglycinamidine synthase I [Actinomycetota bacterium]
VVFPGSNCEHDVVHALGLVGVESELVWHRETDLEDFAGVVLPGGFAHG